MRHWYQVPHASTVLPMPDQPRSRLLDLWRDPDSDLVPVRDSIEARRNALVRATG